jgi:hypothetical protein
MDPIESPYRPGAGLPPPELHRLLLRLDRRRYVTNEIKKAFDFLRSFASIFKVKIGEI